MDYFRVFGFISCLKIFVLSSYLKGFCWIQNPSLKGVFVFVFGALNTSFHCRVAFTVSVEKVNHQFYCCSIEGHVHFFSPDALLFSLCHWSSLFSLEVSGHIFLFIYLPWGSLKLWINELTYFISIRKFLAIVSANIVSALISSLSWLQLYTY